MNLLRWFGLGVFGALSAFAAGSVLAGADQPTPPHASITITRADDGKTVAANLGDSVLVKLGDDFNWTITASGQPLLRRVPNVLLIRGAQGLYDVQRPGETDWTATGSPICAPEQPCPLLLATFRVHISVAGSLKYGVSLPQLASDSGTARLVMLSGTAVAGPTCPVQRVLPDPACADRPVSGAEVLLVNDSGAQVGHVVTGSDGRFSIALSPGTYTLRPQRVVGLLGTAGPQTIDASGDDVEVVLRYDTGIR